MLEYKIIEKEQFTVMGVSQKFNTETSYQEIPKFRQECGQCFLVMEHCRSLYRM